MNEEIDTIAVFLNTKRALLCAEFVNVCRSKPSTHWTDIEAAVKANKEIEYFDYYTEKYLGYVFDNARYCFHRKVESI